MKPLNLQMRKFMAGELEHLSEVTATCDFIPYWVFQYHEPSNCLLISVIGK